MWQNFILHVNLRVRLDVSDSVVLSTDKMPPKTKIFVGKLPPTCKDFELRKLFERFGEVTECSILGNYAFVHMKTEDQAGNAIRNLNNWDLNGFKISVEVGFRV